MADPPLNDPNDGKAILDWLMRIQGAKDRAAEWMTAIKLQQEDQCPKASEAKKPHT
jgi:hypothetical protein